MQRKIKVTKISNAFDSKGEIFAKYQKTHLFSLNDKNGKNEISEDSWCVAGQKLLKVELDTWQVGLAICYDLRFPELFCSLSTSKNPLDVVIIPSAFTYLTGKAHWHSLLKARAIENLIYIVAVNQTGQHSKDRRSYGHSVVISPWG